MKKKKFLIIAILVLVVGVIFFIISRLVQKNKYEKVNPVTGEITESVYSLGKVKSHQRYEIKLGVTSTIQKIFVQEGDFVNKDQNLLMLDSRTILKAPFSGTVTLLAVNEGETVSPQMIVLRLENLKNRYIELTLEQEGALRVKKGQSAKITFESQRGLVLEGHVTAIFPKENDFTATVEVEKLDENILPSMSADVSVEIGKIKGVLVPFKAVRNGMLTIERDGQIKKIKVETGLIDGLSAEIKNSDLKMTDLVLVNKE